MSCFKNTLWHLSFQEHPKMYFVSRTHFVKKLGYFCSDVSIDLLLLHLSGKNGTKLHHMEFQTLQTGLQLFPAREGGGRGMHEEANL